MKYCRLLSRNGRTNKPIIKHRDWFILPLLPPTILFLPAIEFNLFGDMSVKRSRTAPRIAGSFNHKEFQVTKHKLSGLGIVRFDHQKVPGDEFC